jgi:hypothetical protein
MSRSRASTGQLIANVVHWSGEAMRRSMGGRGSTAVADRELEVAVRRLYARCNPGEVEPPPQVVEAVCCGMAPVEKS